MYYTADDSDEHVPVLDPVERELQEIEDLRQRVLEQPELLACSGITRYLVETEIPRMVAMIRQLRYSSGTSDGSLSSGQGVRTLLGELYLEIDLLRDLVERR